MSKRKMEGKNFDTEIFKGLHTLRELVETTELAQSKVSDKKSKAAGTTVRNTLQEIKALADRLKALSASQTKNM